MKKIIPLALIGLLLFACRGKVQEGKDKVSEPLVAQEIHQELYGNWVGDYFVEDTDTVFDESLEYHRQLNIIIKRITADSVIGQRVLAGDLRDLRGSMKEQGGGFSFVLDEQGPQAGKGQYTLMLKNDTIKGLWTPSTPQVKTTRKYIVELTKRPFTYNPKAMLDSEHEFVDYMDARDTLISSDDDSTSFTVSMYRGASEAIFKLNASTQLLKEADVKNLKRIDLEIIRNTIFARHGFAFSKLRYRQFFDYVAWYVPLFSDVKDQLTPTEKKNIELLARFEKYAKDYYDVFGR